MLDEKLKALFAKTIISAEDTDDVISIIKQLFLEEGWVDVNNPLDEKAISQPKITITRPNVNIGYINHGDQDGQS